MTSQKTVRIGCASAFWGDTAIAAHQLIHGGQLDYLVFDYLAEMTLSIMASAQIKNPSAGFAPDFIATLKPLLGQIKSQGVKVCSNAGGINARGCAEALAEVVADSGLDLVIAVVEGDNLTRTFQTDQPQKSDVVDMFSGEPLPDHLTSVNAYLGAPSIAAALAAGADIVITGRVVDSAVVLGPLVHEFDWSWQDYDRLARGSLAGHVIECGTQATGGNFTDWHLVKDGYANMGFPIVECHEDGSFIVTKCAGTGGLVSCDTVAEQILYEIGNPEAYLLPDVICDFSQVSLEQTGSDQVRVTGARGRPCPAQYKVSATYMDGYRSNATFMIGGIDAGDKGQVVADAIIQRVRGLLKLKGLADFTAVDIEVLGTEATYGAQTRVNQPREVVVKIAASHQDKKALQIFGAEIAQAATAMAPGITGLVGGRPKPAPRLCLFSFLIDKRDISPTFSLINSRGDREKFRSQCHISETPGFVRPELVEGRELQAHVSCQSSFDSAQDERRSKPTRGGDLMAVPVPKAVAGSANQTTNTFKSTWHNNALPRPLNESPDFTVPLINLALGRSGDKGNHCNIGIIARDKRFLPYIEAALTPQRISEYFAHLLSDRSEVTRYQLPKMKSINIVITHCLGGGGMASLRIDPQGKALAQQLLSVPIAINKSLYEQVAGELE